MSFLWYSAGIVTDFDYANNFSQNNSNEPMRTGVSLYSPQNNPASVYKVLPEQGTEVWFSAYLQVSSVLESQYMQLRATDNTTALCNVYIDDGGSYFKAYARINGTLTLLGTGTMVITSSTYHQVEVHYKRDATEGILQVWIDGILDINFTGNTGAATDLIGTAGLYYVGYLAANSVMSSSEFIVSNKGRIGKKRMQLMYLSGAGDVNTTDGYMDILGNNSTTTKTTVKAGTYIIPSAFKAAGVLKTVSFKLSAADTVKVGIFTKNVTSLKFTPDAARQVSVSCLAGVVTLNSGTDFTEWSVAAGEYLGIYTAAGTLIYASDSSPDNDSLNLGSWYSYVGDAFSLGTEQTYATVTATHYICAYCQYLTPTNIMYLYNNNVGVITEKPWQESKRYMSMSADSQEFLNNCTDLTDAECTAVTALKVTVRAEAGTSIANGQLSIKAAGETTYSDLMSMPTVVNKRHFIFEGVWSKASINSLQVGFKARS